MPPDVDPSRQQDQEEVSPSDSQKAPSSEAVWTFRGFRMGASEFDTAMVHLFRAEVTRANVWRQRLDTTTNWAVITTGAALSIAFSQAIGNHFVILLNTLLVTMFLVIEARRYRYYELWSYRVRLMETDFFASMLVPPFQPSADWAEALAESLLHPHFPISILEAVGRRLRRNYVWIYTILLAAWLVKLWLHPFVAQSLGQLYPRASIGPISGDFVLLISLAVYGLLLLLGLATVGLQEAAGEVLPRYGDLEESIAATLSGSNHEAKKRRAWFRPSFRRPQLLTIIITDHAKAVAERILKEMHRGVTAMNGTGMYTGKTHEVLICALTITEVSQLKALASEEDPNAFIVVTPAKEIFGHGFIPLEEDEQE